MTYVALAEAAALVIICSLFSGLLRSVLHSSQRREDQLLDKVLHAAGKPWTPAPIDDFVPPAKPIYDDEGEMQLSQQYARFTLTPEQEP